MLSLTGINFLRNEDIGSNTGVYATVSGDVFITGLEISVHGSGSATFSSD